MHIAGIRMDAAPGKAATLAALCSQWRDNYRRVLGEEAMTWSVLVGAPYGTFTVSARCDSLADFAAKSQAFAADAGVRDTNAAIGACLYRPAEVLVSKIIAVAGDYKPKLVTVLTTAVVTGGKMSKALAWSTEMTEFAAGVGGAPVLLAAGVGGRFTQLTWLAGFDSVADFESQDDKLMANPGYLSRLDQLEGVFEPGSDQRTVAVQMP